MFLYSIEIFSQPSLPSGSGAWCLSYRPNDEAVVLIRKLPLGVPDVATHYLAVTMTQGAAAGVPQEHRGHGKILTRNLYKGKFSLYNV